MRTLLLKIQSICNFPNDSKHGNHWRKSWHGCNIGNHDEPTKRRNTMNHDALEHKDDDEEDQMQHVASVPNVDNIQVMQRIG